MHPYHATARLLSDRRLLVASQKHTMCSQAAITLHYMVVGVRRRGL